MAIFLCIRILSGIQLKGDMTMKTLSLDNILTNINNIQQLKQCFKNNKLTPFIENVFISIHPDLLVNNFGIYLK